MATREDFTAEEWRMITAAPQMASLYIMFSSPSGIVGSVKEMMVFPRLVLEVIKNSSGNSLIDSLAADVKGKIERQEKPDLQLAGKKVEEAKAESLQAVRALAWMLDNKSIPDAQGFKQWVYHVAQLVAEAAKEGGLFGFGGTIVSEAEVEALKDLARVLGITTQQ